MIDSELDGLLQHMHDAARAGHDLNAVNAGAVAALLGVDALTLSIASARSASGQRHLELLWYDPAEPLGANLDDLQYTLGEGPTLDALRLRIPVLDTDLTAGLTSDLHTGVAGKLAADPAAAPVTRWLVFTPAALATPARAVIALPLVTGVVAVAVLTGYRRTPGPFGHQHEIDRFARAALDLLTHTPPARLSAATTAENGLPLHRARVHQAAGILSVQLDLPIDQALLRLRAHAYAHDQPLLEVADAIITHQLHLPARLP